MIKFKEFINEELDKKTFNKLITPMKKDNIKMFKTRYEEVENGEEIKDPVHDWSLLTLAGNWGATQIFDYLYNEKDYNLKTEEDFFKMLFHIEYDYSEIENKDDTIVDILSLIKNIKTEVSETSKKYYKKASGLSDYAPKTCALLDPILPRRKRYRVALKLSSKKYTQFYNANEKLFDKIIDDVDSDMGLTFIIFTDGNTTKKKDQFLKIVEEAGIEVKDIEES